MKKLTFLASMAALAMASSPAFAQNLVKNGGFETTSTTSSNGDFQLTASNTYGSVANWATTGQYNLLYHGNATTSASNVAGDFSSSGSSTAKEYLTPGTQPAAFTTSGNFLALDGDASSGAASAVTQTILGLTAGQAYTLSFDWAAASLASRTGALTDGLTAAIAGQTFTTGQAAIGSGLQHASYNFVYTGGSTVLSFLSSGTPNGAPPVALLDNVSLIAAVPEPTTWAMMLIGFGMIGATVRRRQRQPVMAAA